MFLSKHEKIAFSRCNSSELQAKKQESNMLQKFQVYSWHNVMIPRKCLNGIPN